MQLSGILDRCKEWPTMYYDKPTGGFQAQGLTVAEDAERLFRY